MRGAFVVRLGQETNPSNGHFAGSIEEVDSGKELKFQSSTELLRFLGKRFLAAFEETSEDDKRITPKKKTEAEAGSKNPRSSNADSRRRGAVTVQRTSTPLAFVLISAATCAAQNGLIVRGAGKQDWQADAQRVYQSACLALQREFRIVAPIRPDITLIVGAHENGAYADSKAIRLINWDPYLFAQGVAAFAFDELLAKTKRMAVAKRAVIWATSAVDANFLASTTRD